MSREKREREAVENLEKLLAKPIAPTNDYIGEIDPETDESKYFDPWDLFDCVYGNYSSAFDDMALTVLTNLAKEDGNKRQDEGLAHEMFREMLCNADLCDYGTSPRVCFPNGEFRDLLPQLIEKWKQYYELVWGYENES